MEILLLQLVNLILDILAYLFIVCLCIWIPLFVFKNSPSKKYKNLVKTLEKVNEYIIKMWKRIYEAFFMLTMLIFSILIGIGLKPYIYILNKPLGQGYALFASYAVACLIFWFLMIKNKS